MAPVRKAARAAAAPVAEAPAEEAAGVGHNSRHAARHEMRVPNNRAVAIGRDGKPIWRHGSAVHNEDQFAIPDGIRPDGWSWEWKRYTVLNEPQVAYQAKLSHVGWTYVMAESYPGVFMPVDKVGPIIRDGMVLMERPEALTEEAKREEKRAADDRISRSRQQHGLAPVSGGVDTDTRAARANTFVKVARDTGLDIPRPTYDRQPID